MAFSVDKPDTAEDPRIFLERLDDRVREIEASWRALRADGWSLHFLQILFDRICRLNEEAALYKADTIAEKLFSVEVYLSSFVDAVSQPSAAQMDELDSLIHLLRSAVNASGRSNHGIDDGLDNAQRIYFLCQADSPLEPVAAIVQAAGAHVEKIRDAEQLLKAIGARPPNAIVADTHELPLFAPIAAEISRLGQQSIPVPLIFAGESDLLALRLEAMRAGGQAYFTAPFDVEAMSQEIRHLANPRQTDPEKVLVVEDDPTQAEFAASILRKAGMEAAVVTEPLRIMDTLQNFHPDLILMDIYMPDVNGIELTSIIREHRDFMATPIVFLSGEQNREKQLAALSVGGDDFVAKPIRPKHLIAVVRNRIARSKNMQRTRRTPAQLSKNAPSIDKQLFLDALSGAIDNCANHADSTGLLYFRIDRYAQLVQGSEPSSQLGLVKDVAQRIKDATLARDVLSQVNTCDIALLARRATPASLAQLAEDIRDTVAAKAFALKNRDLTLTLSASVFVVNAGTQDAAAALALAAQACETATERSGNSVQVEEQHNAVAKPSFADAHITHQLIEALAEHSFVIRYQPLLDVHERGRESYELQLRLPMSNGDLIGERDFREAALHAGVSGQIDQYLVEQALTLLQSEGEAEHGTTLFVRLSESSAVDPSFPVSLGDQLRQRNMEGTGIVLMYRIADLSRDLKAAKQNLQVLRNMDIRACITRFPEKPAAFKVLSFLRTDFIEVAPRLLKAEHATISMIVNQAHEANAKVIVSHIDDPRGVDLHWSSGADLLQGNFIQRPLEQMDHDFFQLVV